MGNEVLIRVVIPAGIRGVSNRAWIGTLNVSEIACDPLNRRADRLIGASVDSESRFTILPIVESVCHSICWVYVSPPEIGASLKGLEKEAALDIVLGVPAVLVPAEVIRGAVISVRAAMALSTQPSAFRRERPLILQETTQLSVAISVLSAVLSNSFSLALSIDTSS